MPKQTDQEDGPRESGKPRVKEDLLKPQLESELADDEEGDICAPRHESTTDDDAPLP